MSTPVPPRDSESEGQQTRPRQRRRRVDRVGTDRIRQVAMAMVGGALLVRGLRQRSLRGALTALVGGWLLSRTVGGPTAIRQRIRPRIGGDHLSGEEGDAGGASVSRSVTVGKPVDEVYEAWRDPDVLSRVLGHVGEVTPTGEDRYRLTIHGPLGQEVSLEPRIVEAEPGERISWETPADAILPNSGSIRLQPATGDRGTMVTFAVGFDPPGGELGRATLERLDFVPETVVGHALSRFKSLVETGEIPTLEANPSGRGRGDRL